MGYTTDFSGSFQLSRYLTTNENGILHDLANIRHDDEDPDGVPGIWCQWIPGPDRKSIVWDGGEKFYNYDSWLQYIIDKFLSPWGITLSGEVRYRGERFDDMGKLAVVDGKVKRLPW